MEGLLDTVYAKLLELMFRPVEPEQVPAAKQGGLLDALNTLIDNRGRTWQPEYHRIRPQRGVPAEGPSLVGPHTLNFNHRATVERHSFITFNIGDFYQRYGTDPAYFRDVSLEDPTFLQREIHDRSGRRRAAGVRALHQWRHGHAAEAAPERSGDAAGAGARPADGCERARRGCGWSTAGMATTTVPHGCSTTTGRDGASRAAARTRPSGRGRATPLIYLFTPYERRSVQIVGDRQALMKRQVRAVTVEVEYPFFGDRRRQSVIVRPDATGEDPRIDITLPWGRRSTTS